MTTLETFQRARNRAVPIIGIETQDPANTARWIQKALNGKADTTPVILWDICQGLTGKNDLGTTVAQELQPEFPLTNPSEMLPKILQAPPGSIVIMSNAHRFIENESVLQGVWNCRDTFKQNQSTLVLLGPAIKLPVELTQDAVILSEELPGEKELAGIIKEQWANVENFKGKPIPKEVGYRTIDTLRGLSAFAAEQTLALAFNANGIDEEALWQRKAKMIEQTPGLAVWRGGESFDDLGGLSNLKEFLTKVLTSGKTPVRAIGFIDEIEKGMAGSTGDTSGTSQDQLQVFLKSMQDLEIPGMILVGHAGTGKSCIAKGAGNVAQAPVISIDTGAMKSSRVGSSEARIRAAMDVFKAVSQGKGLFIATCNKIASLPPELRRRFTLGTFFVDLPDEEEQAKIWPIWANRYQLDPTQKKPRCDGWTGAEIRACCDVAYRTGLDLTEAAKFVVPVIKSAPDQVEALRTLAHGRFISASKPGVYQKPTTTGARKMEI